MILFSPDAASDVERVREFLDINNPDAAKRALRTIFAALGRIEVFTDLGRPTEDRLLIN
jgi:toxin ParE1/3/4